MDPPCLLLPTSPGPCLRPNCLQQQLPQPPAISVGGGGWGWGCCSGVPQCSLGPGAPWQAQASLPPSFVASCWPLMCARLCASVQAGEAGGVLSQPPGHFRVGGHGQNGGDMRTDSWGFGWAGGHKGASVVTDWEGWAILRGGQGREAWQLRAPTPLLPWGPHTPVSSHPAWLVLQSPAPEGRGNLARDVCKNRCISG